MENAVELRRITKRFGGHLALNDCSLTIKPGEFVTLLGASGCGKTTTIRIIAGYLTQSAGEVLIDGREVTRLPPQKRGVGMVFQDYALFPHLTVRENIGFGLKVRRWPRTRTNARIDELLEMTGLTSAGAKKPRELSGGMQQRVAVARALAFQPRLMLMDEPLAALDVKLREAMQLELIRLQREVGVTTLYVTHDQQEAMRMSDRIVVMNEGAVQQIGTPRDIYATPTSRFVADFVGASNLLQGNVESASRSGMAVRVGRALVHSEGRRAKLGTSVTLMLRPEVVQVNAVADDANRFSGVIQDVAFMGSWVRLTVAVPELDEEVVAQVAPERHWQAGDDVQVSWRPEASVPLAAPAATDAGTAEASGDADRAGPAMLHPPERERESRVNT
jgi:ABC-type Fe3+/spermidine/putrescine transport system ATPase subunit